MNGYNTSASVWHLRWMGDIIKPYYSILQQNLRIVICISIRIYIWCFRVEIFHFGECERIASRSKSPEILYPYFLKEVFFVESRKYRLARNSSVSNMYHRITRMMIFHDYFVLFWHTGGIFCARVVFRLWVFEDGQCVRFKTERISPQILSKSCFNRIFKRKKGKPI